MVIAAAVEGVGVSGLGGAARDLAVTDLIVAARQAAAGLVSAIGVVDADVAYGDDGHGSCRAWVQAVTNGSKTDAGRLVALSRLCRDMPAVAAGFGAGRIGDSQLSELLHLHANRRCRHQLPESDGLLADLAVTLDFDLFRTACARWRLLADPDGTHHDHHAAHTGRHVSTSIVGTSFDMRAAGGNVDGVNLIAILDHFTDLEFHADWDALIADHGPNPSPALLRRSHAQRRFDALCHIFELATQRTTTPAPAPTDAPDEPTDALTAPTEPTAAPPHPTTTPAPAPAPASRVPVINFVIDLATFEREIRRAAGLYVEPDDLTTVMNRRSETSDGIPIDPAEIVAAALIGQARRIVTDAAGVTLDAGRRRRFFTGPLRDAVLATNPRCTWPGCGLPSRQSQLDHATEWTPTNDTTGGATCTDNANILCGHHNRHKQHGYTTWRDPAGHWHTVRPDGTEITPRAGPSP